MNKQTAVLVAAIAIGGGLAAAGFVHEKHSEENDTPRPPGPKPDDTSVPSPTTWVDSRLVPLTTKGPIAVDEYVSKLIWLHDTGKPDGALSIEDAQTGASPRISSFVEKLISKSAGADQIASRGDLEDLVRRQIDVNNSDSIDNGESYRFITSP